MDKTIAEFKQVANSLLQVASALERNRINRLPLSQGPILIDPDTGSDIEPPSVGTIARLMDAYEMISKHQERLRKDMELRRYIPPPSNMVRMAGKISRLLDDFMGGRITQAEAAYVLGRYANCGLLDDDGRLDRTAAGRLGRKKTALIYRLTGEYFRMLEESLRDRPDKSRRELQVLRRIEADINAREGQEARAHGEKPMTPVNLRAFLYEILIEYHALYYMLCPADDIINTHLGVVPASAK